jgi:hypothetical protein
MARSLGICEKFTTASRDSVRFGVLTSKVGHDMPLMLVYMTQQ